MENFLWTLFSIISQNHHRIVYKIGIVIRLKTGCGGKRSSKSFLKPFHKNQPSQEDISYHSHPNSYLRGLSVYHSGQRGWKYVNTTRMDSVSLEKGVTKDMKTKSVEACVYSHMVHKNKQVETLEKEVAVLKEDVENL